MKHAAAAAGLSLAAYLASASQRHEVGLAVPAQAYQQLAARAEQAGLSPGAYLVMAATNDADAGLSGPEWTIQQRRSLAAELFSTHRGLRRAEDNLNRLTRVAHSRGRVPKGVPQVVEEIVAMLTRLEAIVTRLDPRTAGALPRRDARDTESS